MSTDESKQDDAAYTEGLADVVRFNEGIKQIVGLAETVSMDAVNAMLRARKVGAQASGFGASSLELRAFSSQLAEIMDALSTQVHGQVAAVARLRGLERRNHILTRAQESCTDKRTMESVIAERLEVEDEQRRAVCQSWRSLILALTSSEKSCRIGLSIARSSKIEAVYGLELAGQLTQVSSDIEHCVGDLLSTIKFLQRVAQHSFKGTCNRLMRASSLWSAISHSKAGEAR